MKGELHPTEPDKVFSPHGTSTPHLIKATPPQKGRIICMNLTKCVSVCMLAVAFIFLVVSFIHFCFRHILLYPLKGILVFILNM